MQTVTEKRPTGYEPQFGPQYRFHARNEDIVGYGGTKGPGKTQGLIGESLRQIDNPHYHGAFFRRTYPQLQEIMDRAHKIFPMFGGKWKEQRHRYEFPSGAKISFFHVQHEKDVENYQGKEFQFIGIDQLEQFTEYMFHFLCAQNRTSHAGLRCYVRVTFNPGGIGHQWIKKLFITGKEREKTYKLEYDIPGIGTVSRTYCFVFGSVFDNKILLQQNPQYLATLYSLPEKMRKAYLEGDWDVFEGQFFDNWSPKTHVINSFDIPEHWAIYQSLDWGYSKPLSCHWWAVPPDAKHIYCIAEYYVTRTQSHIAAQEIHQNSMDMFGEDYIARRRISNFYVDPSVFWTKGDTGKSIREDFEAVLCSGEGENKVTLQLAPADNDRIAGWNVFRKMLEIQKEDGLPYCLWFNRCVNAIDTIPSLQHDDHRVEDVDTEGEDHAADDHRYFFMERFGPGKVPQKDTLEHLKINEASYKEWKVVQEKVLKRVEPSIARTIMRMGG